MGAAGAAGGVADQFCLARVGCGVELGDDLDQDGCGLVSRYGGTGAGSVPDYGVLARVVTVMVPVPFLGWWLVLTRVGSRSGQAPRHKGH